MSEELVSSDLVVGPTYDGGYYVVGAKTSHAGLFTDSAMEKRMRLKALLARAHGMQLSVSFTDPFYDVADNLSLVAAEVELAPARVPCTANWLVDSRATGRLRPDNVKP